VFAGQVDAGVGYDDGNGRLEGGEAVDEEFLESLLIIVLATSVVLLILYRQQRVLRERREMERQAGGAGGAGGAGPQGDAVFPEPGGVMFGAPPLP